MRFITPLLILSASLLLITFAFTTTLVFASSYSSSSSSSSISAGGSDEMSSPPDFPSHWGQPPLRQTRDYVELPNPYGFGSGTLRKWIEEKLAEDIASSGTATARSAVDETDTKNKLQQWPELDLVGYTGEDAKFAILAASKDEMNVFILPEDSMVTMDYRTDRVRVFVNDEGKVVRQPTIG
jgi:hypothetical protein